MSLITESSLRAMFKKEVPTSIVVQKGDLLTPSARQYLKEKGVAIDDGSVQPHKVEERKIVENHYRDFIPIETAFKPKYVSNYDGGYYEVKPEHMTHLHGNKLVYKDDPRIVFRGRLDSLQSTILDTQLQFITYGSKVLVKELDEVLATVRNTLRAEVLNEPIAIQLLIGLTDEELREHSHHPKKHYGVEHFIPDVSMGIEVVLLNRIRTEIREVELVAMHTFKREGDVARGDIIKVLNRLSSTVYLLMCRVRGGYYKKESGL